LQIRPLARDEVRGLDARAASEFGISGLVLMENAGRGAADWLLAQSPPLARMTIACGPGNNGGDGGVVARHLDAAGLAVRVAWFADPDRLSPDAAAQFRTVAASGIEQIVVADPDDLAALWIGADWLVDGLLGTGLARPPEGRIAAAIVSMNRSGLPILALDVPSGLDADTGRPPGEAVRARATATFVAPKLGFAAEGASAFTGDVYVIAIGVPRIMLEPFRLG